MFIYHLSSACDVCLQPYREEEPANKQPHVIPCCHIFCKECLEAILNTTTDDQRRGRCPLFIKLYVTGIKKLHVDAPAVSNEEYANNGLLRMVLEAWDGGGDYLTALITQVDSFLQGEEENEFLSLRKVRQAIAERERMQKELSVNKTTIRTMKKTMKALEASRMDEAVVSQVKEVSAQELESQLEKSRAEVHLLHEYIAQMENEGRRAAHRSKGKGRANATLEPNLGASTSHNPLPRPPQPIYSYPLVEDSDPEMARAIEESMRPQRNHYNQDSGPIAGPSRTDAIGTSHTLTNGHVATHSSVPSTSRPHSNGATDAHRTQSARKITSNLPHNYYPRQNYVSPSPSPPPQILMQPGPVDLDRMAMSAPSAPDISERDLYALRRSVENLGLQHADRDASRRKSQPSRRHRKDDDHSRRGWAREAGRQEQMRGVTGLGLINENLDEDIGIHTDDPRASVAPQIFEFPGARVVSSTATNSMTGLSGVRPNDPSFDSRIRQAVAESYRPVHQPLLDPDAQSLLSNETTGTWHSQQPEPSGEPHRQSVTADIMPTLNFFPSPSDAGSISSISSTTFSNAFLPPEPPSNSRNPTSVPSRTSHSDASIPPTMPTVGSSSTSLGFFPAETPRPNGSSAAMSAPRSSQQQRERARPRPTRHLTQPVGIDTRTIDSLRGTGTQTTLGNPPGPSFPQTPASRHNSASTFTPIAEDPQGHNSDFGNALGLDLSRDLGPNSRQTSSQGNPQLVAPRPRASAPHQHFLRSFSGGL
ncbi:hypothetical protein PQX77_007486 [Marasmius sp. AFHP31]|nr:hypothetical protein PQX77_007486 [Marasmius sp. AFHP31]